MANKGHGLAGFGLLFFKAFFLVLLKGVGGITHVSFFYTQAIPR